MMTPTLFTVEVSSVECLVEDAQRMHRICKWALRVICAWCPDFDPTQQEAGNSHGMCPACSIKMNEGRK